MVKKLLIIMLAVCMTLTLGGCKSKKKQTAATVAADTDSTAGAVSEGAHDELAEESSGGVSFDGDAVNDKEYYAAASEYYLGAYEVKKPDPDLSEYVRDDEGFQYLTFGDNISLYKYNGTASKLIVPAKIDGKTVKDIYSECFAGCTDLKAVYMEDGITKLDSCMFSRCINLTEIRLPETIVSISWNAFEECISLRNIYTGLRQILKLQYIRRLSLERGQAARVHKLRLQRL